MSTDVSKNVNATKKFVMLEVDARIVAAFKAKLKLTAIDGHPSSDVLPTKLLSAPRKEKQQFLKLLATRVVNKYILDEEKVAALLDKRHHMACQHLNPS